MTRLDQLKACHHVMSECERGGAKRRRESIVNENSKVAPPGLSSFRHPCLKVQISKLCQKLTQWRNSALGAPAKPGGDVLGGARSS